MKVKSTRFLSKNTDDEMLVVFILDNQDREVAHYTFYNKDEETRIEPELKDTMQNLPSLLKMMYNSGLRSEPLDFSEEKTYID